MLIISCFFSFYLSHIRSQLPAFFFLFCATDTVVFGLTNYASPQNVQNGVDRVSQVVNAFSGDSHTLKVFGDLKNHFAVKVKEVRG